MFWGRELVPRSQPAPRQRARAYLRSWGPWGARSARRSSEVMHASNPNDITKQQPHSFKPSACTQIRLQHVPYWDHLVYNLGPRIWTNVEVSLATKRADLTTRWFLLRDKIPHGRFLGDPTHIIVAQLCLTLLWSHEL